MTLALTDDCLLVTSLTTKKVNRKEIVHAYAPYIHEPVQKISKIKPKIWKP